MKTIILLLLFASCCLMPRPSTGQGMAKLTTDEPEQVGQPKQQSLQTILENLETKYKVRFNYASRVVADKFALAPLDDQLNDIEAVLQTVLPPLGLSFEEVKSGVFFIRAEEAVEELDTQRMDMSSPEASVSQMIGPMSASTENHAIVLERTISGSVTDFTSGEPLPGVNILVKGTTVGTVSDVDGRFSLVVSDDAQTLVFSSVGYLSEEVGIGTQTVFDVSLSPDIQSLQELVVVGYGEQKKADVTGATATVTSEEFNTGVINNPLQAVQGKVAGLNISSTDSDPTGSRPIIRLRGIGSLTANTEPLIVIDGVLGASLNSVAPEDIAKYDVLKDASATAIYGSRGANGVIIITTKRGTAGKTMVDYSTYVGFSSAANKPNVLSPEAYFNKYNELNPDEPSTATTRTDWFDEITRTAVSQNHSLAISGGADGLTYRGSVAYLNQPGIAINSGYDRLNTRLNITQQSLNDRLKVQINLSANLYNKDFTDYGAFTRAVRYSPLLSIRNPDGSFNVPAGLVFDFQNPVSMLDLETSEAKDKQMLGNLKVSFEILEGLEFGVNTSYSVFSTSYGFFRPKTYFDKNDVINTNVSRGRRSTGEVHDRLLEYTLNYQKVLGNSSLGILVGYTYQSLTNEGFEVSASDFPDRFSYNNLGAADQDLTRSNVGSYRSESKLDGILARVNYSYADKYLLTANFRRDGSSRFGENNRYGYFPSVSAGWIISREGFMADLGAITFLKLRAGYGITGNQNGISDYASRLLFGTSGNYASPTTSLSNPIDYKTAYFYTQNANPDLQWETSAMANIGLDFGLFGNRLSGSIDVYNKQTENLLYTYSVPVGDKYGDGLTYINSSFLANIGTMNNKGIEVAFDLLAIDKEDFQWNTVFNIAHNKNEVVELSGEGLIFPEEGIRYGVINAGTNAYGTYSVLKEGLPVGTFWAPKEVGLNEDGRPLYEVIDEETGEVLEPTATHGQATRQDLGSAQPKVTMGWTNNLKYKNFDLSIFVQSSLGQKVFNGSNLVYNNPTTFRAGDAYPVNVYASTFEGDNANLNLAGAVSSRYLEDASFVRLSNVNLGYNFKLNSEWIRNLRLYVAGQNLLLITAYNGLDPEVRSGSTINEYGGVNNSSDNLAFGLDDFFFYPRARTFTVGLSVGF